MNTIIETTGGRRESSLFSRDHGPANTFERYYAPDLLTVLDCCTSEREECEADTGLVLDTDVLNQVQWDALVVWMKANAAAKSRPACPSQNARKDPNEVKATVLKVRAMSGEVQDWKKKARDSKPRLKLSEWVRTSLTKAAPIVEKSKTRPKQG